MSITTSYDKQSNQATICVNGIFNFDKVMEFRDAYELKNWHKVRLTIDLKNCSYLDSAALGALLLMKSQLDKADSEIIIQPGESTVRKVLADVHFEKKFIID